MTVRILCTGSRGWTDEAAIRRALVELEPYCVPKGPASVIIVHGACPTGADAIVDRVARELGYTVERHPADWSLDGKSAGFIRNAYMVRQGAALCLAFWDGKSNGTRDCFTRAVVAGIPARIVPQKPKE